MCVMINQRYTARIQKNPSITLLQKYSCYTGKHSKENYYYNQFKNLVSMLDLIYYQCYTLIF